MDDYSTYIYGCLYFLMSLCGTNSCHQEVLILKLLSTLLIEHVVDQIKYFDQKLLCRCPDEA